ncbi:serine/threonine protein kinase [Streptomyces sp. ISL-112]|uniref:serine/threonine-protein kinase n=1 Tax=unclassified Streptomyces TaxID=2593676 RepID=UPI001BE9F22F|nr:MULTISPECIES: serine/threonine-protein kinase [unclassified Streptomyces]MBT2424327.1 serine/threonine protein kinase [Streptomyces sp. ISL-112]MBT2463647.1 serine/threonine protein kinase [Streptomyces sp. ISL-63]
MRPLEAGEPHTIGSYRLLGRLGAGGMGRVYLGRSAGGRTVAVKVVHPHFALDEQFRARFRREVEAARRIGAQWTAPVLDADPDAPVPWVATGYVAGPPLSQAITEHGPLPEHAVRTLGAGLAEALHVVHGQGIVHRDVKPSNVLLALDGPRLIDFGIARALGATVSLTSTGVSVGSPGYMAPEQIRGRDISGAADVFSLGAVLAYAATGAAPFSGDSSAVLLYKVVHEEPELGDLEGELREVVAGCLAKDPDARPVPADLARTLAPGGAAAMVAAGWLPGRLVGEVSRSAVALLNLEPQDAPAASGPVPFSSASLGAGFGAGADAHEGPGADSRRGSDGSPGAESGLIGVFGPPLVHVPDSPPGTPPPPTTPPGGFPGQRAHAPRFSVTVSADSQTGTDTSTGAGARRSRRVSCTAALAVAGSFVVVALGSGLLDGFFPGGDTDRRKENDSAAARPSPTATATASEEPGASASAAPTDAGEAPVSEVPKAFVGTWEGPLTERTTGQPHGTLTAAFAEGEKGTRVVRMSTTITQLGLTVTCNSVGTLTSGTAKELEVRERTDPDRPSTPGLCTTTEADLVFRLAADGTLGYRSKERGAGLPYGTLTRSGG